MSVIFTPLHDSNSISPTPQKIHLYRDIFQTSEIPALQATEAHALSALFIALITQFATWADSIPNIV